MTLFRLNDTGSSSSRYFLAIDPLKDIVYISLPLERRIIRLVDHRQTLDPKANWIPVAGTGETCRGVRDSCDGKGDPASAKLVYPKVTLNLKPSAEELADWSLFLFLYSTIQSSLVSITQGLALTIGGDLYFADGRTLKRIDPSGRLTTILGSPDRRWIPPLHWSK